MSKPRRRTRWSDVANSCVTWRVIWNAVARSRPVERQPSGHEGRSWMPGTVPACFAVASDVVTLIGAVDAYIASRPVPDGAVVPARQDERVTPDATDGSPAASVPTYGIDPRISLASTLQSSRTTAVLLGSGMSRAAGIPTGWEVTLDLVERVARASGVDASEDFDAELWWRDQGHGEPTYDLLVAALGLTDHDRRLLLRRYFEYDHRTGEPATPTQAHHDLAALIARGSVPVVVTTNFDQLLERALADVNVTPQVLSSPTHFAGRTPLTHADFTLVKLHGDYATGQLRNAPDELATYPQGWKRLLNQIFDEYGLLVTGWSALYDRTLVEAMRTTVGRRYAWYWANHQGSLEPDAQRVTTALRAHHIDIQGCDELFADLRTQAANLDQIARRGSTWRPTPVVHRIGSQRPQGWACMPCVVIRAAAFLGAGEGGSGLLLPDVRAAVSEALDAAAITAPLPAGAERPGVRLGPPAADRADRYRGGPDRLDRSRAPG